MPIPHQTGYAYCPRHSGIHYPIAPKAGVVTPLTCPIPNKVQCPECSASYFTEQLTQDARTHCQNKEGVVLEICNQRLVSNSNS
jgi:hypothetical protein